MDLPPFMLIFIHTERRNMASSLTASGAIEIAFISFAVGAVTSFFLWGDVLSSKRKKGSSGRKGDEDEDEDEDDADDGEEEESTAASKNGIRDFSNLHASFKMVLCVNMSLNMGKGE